VKERLFIFGGLIALVLVLIGLNAAAFSRKNKLPDNEFYPNRSTYNSDSTGTRAVYDLLAETGRKVIRWQEKPSVLLANTKNRPAIFVIIGRTRRDITDADAELIMRWVSEGGRLVVIDRQPMDELVKTTANWKVSFNLSKIGDVSVTADTNKLTEKSESLKPIQPTPYTRGVNSIKPSILASQIDLTYLNDTDAKENPVINTDSKIKSAEEDFDESPAIMAPTPESEKESDKQPVLNAPVIHFGNENGAILADFPFGKGEVVFLSDPFIVANNGLKLADNSHLAINLLSTTNGITAFDEFHQGYGKSDDRLAAYFEGTPVFAILAQIGLFFGLFFWSNGRRFARALPNGEKNRLSKLEYVTAMAEIQENIKAYDLAIDNIFSEFRRNLIRFTGSDNTISNEKLAFLVAEKSEINSAELNSLMNDCQAIHQGEKTNKSEVLKLSKRIREFEELIGIKRVKRRKL
jgi:Domain of unknown function (DUF4350)